MFGLHCLDLLVENRIIVKLKVIKEKIRRLVSYISYFRTFVLS